jgi:hypothetical protein
MADMLRRKFTNDCLMVCDHSRFFIHKLCWKLPTVRGTFFIPSVLKICPRLQLICCHYTDKCCYNIVRYRKQTSAVILTDIGNKANKTAKCVSMLITGVEATFEMCKLNTFEILDSPSVTAE